MPEPKLIEVEFEWHRWYVVVTEKFETGSDVVTVIGSMPGEGIAAFDSVEEFEEYQ